MLDLRDLMIKIKQQKEMNANLSLEFDCVIETENPTPLIKVINYIINYLTPLSDKAIEIQLNTQMSGILLCFSIFTDKTTFPALNEQVAEALNEYNATLQIKKEEGKFFQILIVFAE